MFYYIKSISNTEEPTVEFMDEENHPLIVAPISQAVKFKLSYKVIWVCFMDYKRRIYISRRAAHCEEYPNFLDFSISGYVLAQESREDAVIRQLLGHLGIHEATALYPNPCSIQSNGVPIFVTIYIVGPSSLIPEPNPKYIQDGFFLDKEELTGLAAEIPELLTPHLLWAINNDLLRM